jgi:hypothetical protein
VRRWLFIAAALLAPRDALADDARPAFDPRIVRVATLAIGGAAAIAGVGRAPPMSLVCVAWPGAYRGDATWSVPDGGRKPMLYVTLVDVRF